MVGRGIGDSAVAHSVLGSSRTWKIAGQTLFMALAATGGSILLGIPGAYVLYRLDFPGQRLLRALVSVPFALPTIVVGIAFRVLLDSDGPLGFLGWQESTVAVIAAMIFFNYCVVVRSVGTMWQGLGDLAVAARTLGASPCRAFLTVTLPQLGPAIAASGALVFLFCSTSFGIVSALGRPGYGTLESEIYIQTKVYMNFPVAAVLSVLQLLFVVFALILSSVLSARTERYAPQRVRPRQMARSDLPAVVITAGMLLFLAAPMISLVLGSLHAADGWGMHNYRVLHLAGSGFAGGTSVLSALNHSIKIAWDAAIIAVIVGIIVAFAGSRRPRSRLLSLLQRLADTFILLPLGISAVTVGFGFLITWGRISTIPSGMIVPLAQAVVALPLVVRSLVPILRSIDPRMRQAAATLGATPIRIALTIDLPIMARGIGVVFGFAFAISLGEFGATSFLANPDYVTLPVLISRLLGRPGVDNYGMALAGSVILMFLTMAVMFAADLLRLRGRKENT
ncbi:ABC transporter permease [Trueperella sp. LYQ141]|uniref:ABC transporter permease n=1 Tax=Trueperella sp. LYQ141 TaxID=3391058 RepID=UPI00398378B3